MERKIVMLLLIGMLSASLLFGCSPKEMEQKIESVENSVEQRIDQTENQIENSINQNSTVSANITTEQAQEIALKDAGFAADQVTGLSAETDLYDQVPHYDVKFYQNNQEYEYEINAATGEIMSIEKDE